MTLILQFYKYFIYKEQLHVVVYTYASGLGTETLIRIFCFHLVFVELGSGVHGRRDTIQ